MSPEHWDIGILPVDNLPGVRLLVLNQACFKSYWLAMFCSSAYGNTTTCHEWSLDFVVVRSGTACLELSVGMIFQRPLGYDFLELS